MSSAANDDFHAYTFGAFTLDIGRGALFRDNIEIKLRPQAFEVLRILITRPGKLVSREELQTAVWGHKVVTEDSLAHCIIDIRKALDDNDRKIIHTVPRRGYIFDEMVHERRGPTSKRVSVSDDRRLNRIVLASVILAVAALATLWFFSGADFQVVPTARSKSIAVMPFLDLSEGKTEGYFADGLTEEILNSLAKTPDLLVTARTSSFAYRDSQDDVPTIAAALGVDHILEGSVRKGGDRLRITAQLIRASDGFHIWSEVFDKTPDNIIEIQEEIAIAIASVLQTAMDPEALAKMMRVDTRSVPAFEAYMTGNGAWTASWSDIELRLDAWDAYEKAVALDPEFTRAYDRLFWFWHMQLSANSVSYGLTELTYQEILLKRDESLNNAIRTENDASTLLKYQAHKAWVDMKPKRALRLITEFLEQNPNAQTGRAMRLVLLRYFNMQYEIDEAVEAAYGQRGRLGYAEVGRFWLTALEFSKNKNLMRTVANDIIERFSDDASMLYGAHHVLLIAGDIDGADAILPEILNNTSSRKHYYFADLRQACAELRMADAARIRAQALQEFPGDLSLNWHSNKIMGNDAAAHELFRQYDQSGEFATMYSYLGYAHFDATLYPNFIRALAGQGIEERQIVELPYRCNR